MKEGVLYLRVLSLLSRGGLVMLLATLSISGNGHPSHEGSSDSCRL